MKLRLFDFLIGRGQIVPRSKLELGLLAQNPDLDPMFYFSRPRTR